ncbi:MAG: DUF4124 domain-containing protein [Pseudomonadota bacterium]
MAIALTALLASSATAATRIYKTVDENGNVVYTDVAPKEPEDAERMEIKLPELNQFEQAESEPQSAVENLTPADDEADSEDEPGPIVYQRVALVTPTDDEAIRANNGNLTLQAQILPALDPNHQLRFFVDGAPVGTTRSLTMPLSNVDRGTHTAQVVVINAEGGVAAQSAAHTFHVLRFSILN